SWSRCLAGLRRSGRMRPGPGGRLRPAPWSPAMHGTIRARNRARRAEHRRKNPKRTAMNRNLQRLRAIGQSLWLDNITRQMLDDGTLERWIADFGLTGLTSNPSIFDAAIGGSDAYDAGIREKHGAGASGEALFLELALEDLRRAADLFAPVHEAT